VRIVVASDVDNPLLGPRGAAAVFGPQKGASPTDVNRLERALTVWAERVAEATANAATLLHEMGRRIASDWLLDPS
jgi:glycerate kinase